MEIVTDQSEEILATYNLCVIGPRDDPEWYFTFRAHHERYMRETEENLTDLLPEGYRVVIKEWDSE